MDLSRVAAHEPVAVTDEQREAAVLVPVIEHAGDPHLLFIKRADHLGEHAGQMSFPGGGREPSDDDLLQTALRECREEVGMHTDAVDVVGRIDDIRTVTRYSVRPFVARVPDQEWIPDGREVAEIALLSLTDLMDLDNYESERRDHPHYGDIRIHFFRVDGFTVWGATGRMLAQFLELATGWEMPAQVDRVVDPDADFPV
ncbi:NUDIX hydrolase [Halorarius litoreus]|uniref:NUDIX hydrolase n=1 Tax=Halorarius litoreus TaxID=2962676 RepID=UPI0020CE2801|nr:CoA pyrophosphatase [Halorarius litoreus]